MKYIIFILLIVNTVFAADEMQKNKESNTWAVIVSGISKDSEQSEMESDAVNQLVKFFKKTIKQKNTRVLLSAGSEAYKPGMIESRCDNILNTLSEVRKTILPNDTFIFYYIGQANIVNDQLRFNIPGPDICDKELAEAINAINVKRSLVILDCPASGHAVKYLSAANRVLIASAHVNQLWSTSFSKYFVPAMSDSKADYNNDNNITIVEAFRLASMQQDKYYMDNDLMKTENPLLEDDGDSVATQQPWATDKDKVDGKLASEWVIYSLKRHEMRKNNEKD